MRINLEMINADMTFPLHLFILREENIYYLQVYSLIFFPTKTWIQIADIPSLFCL